jgi:hypothetical protein
MKTFSMHHGLMKKPFATRFIGILLRDGDENRGIDRVAAVVGLGTQPSPRHVRVPGSEQRQVLFLTRLLNVFLW